MDSKKRKMEENGVVESISKEDAKKILDLFSKEQLLEILVGAAVSHPDVLDEIRKLADKDPAHRKIFVRGLGWDTTSETLKGIFSQFGEVEEGVVIMDKSTGKSRGFGFVTFRHMDGAQRALKEPSKRIDGRMTVCQLAATGPTTQVSPSQEIAMRKIYVGNVPIELAADRLLAMFSQWGEIEEGPLGFDKFTGRSRGFALLIYKSAEAAKRALQEPIKTIDGHQMYCKLAAEGQKQKSGGLQQGQKDGESSGSQSLVHFQYGSVNPGLITTGIPLNQGVTQGFHTHQSLSALNQSLSLNPSLSSSYSQGLIQNTGGQGLQVPTSLGMASLGSHVGMNSYGSQQSPYSMGGAAMYAGPASNVGSQATMQGAAGHYALTAYQNPQVTVSSGQRSQTLSSMPSYYL